MGVAFAFSLPCYSKKVLPEIEPYAAGLGARFFWVRTPTANHQKTSQSIAFRVRT